MNDFNTSRRDFLTSTLLAGAGFMRETEAASSGAEREARRVWHNVRGLSSASR